MKKIVLLFTIIVITFQVQAKEHSMKKALFLSACVPGLGQYYVGSKKSAAVYATTELALIFAYFKLDKAFENKKNSIEQFAITYAGAKPGQSLDYYEDVENFDSSEEYNESYLRAARNYYLQNLNPDALDEANEYIQNNVYAGEEEWNWESEEKHTRYSSLYDEKHKLEIYATFAALSTILNRIVSMVDVARSINKEKRLSEKSNLSFVPDYQNKGISVNYEFKF